MRAIAAYLNGPTAEEVGLFLGGICPAQDGPTWTWMSEGDACLFIECKSGAAYDIEFDDAVRRSVVESLGSKPTVTLLASVSGRHPGDAEIRALLTALLDRFRGVAQDEYTDHCWTLDQILSGHRVEGHSFFDCDGWYKAAERK